MRQGCRFAQRDFGDPIEDNATTAGPIPLLPLDPMIKDFSGSGTPAHLLRRLNEAGRLPIPDESAGDLRCIRGRRHLAFLLGDHLSGRMQDRLAPLFVMGEHPLRLTLVS